MKAPDSAPLCVCPETVCALMGGNGASKSTLMKYLIDVCHPSKRLIRVKREPVELTDTMDALHSGVSMIHQELNLVPYITMAENTRLRCEPMKYGSVDHGQSARQTQALLDRLNIRLTTDRLVGDLSIAAQQMVEITKAASWNAGIVIMDGPTPALTEGKMVYLLTIIRDLRVQSKAIIYISHKMDGISVITDETSMFHDGTWAESRNTTEFTRQSLITQMVGHELTQLFPKFNNTIGEEALAVRNLTRHDVFHDVSFTVRRSEILGAAGLVGTERSEMMESLFGMERFDSGEVLIDEAPATIDSLSMVIEKRMVLLTEDRKESGLLLVLSVLENMNIVKMPEYISKDGFVQHVEMAKGCMEQTRQLNIKTPMMGQVISNSNRGNQ